MEQKDFQFVDRTGAVPRPVNIIASVVVPKEAIEAEIERLVGLPMPSNGRRTSYVVNPATGEGQGFAPGIAVSISVLKPGEQTKPIRHNSSELEKMKIHIVEENPPRNGAGEESRGGHGHGENPFGTFQISDDGAQLMPYEKLISPDVVKHNPLHFPWKKVKQELDKLTALGKSYVGRRLYLLYNPRTGHTNGTTSSFFATMCVRPKNIVDRPHRHSAAAINYYFSGKGFSVVEGKKYFWKAGDLMLSAPGWAVHNHASLDEDVYELTVQDSPLNIWMGSLLWQESLDQPIESLGMTGGFTTNRPA